MKIKENDLLPNSEVFIIESGEPTKKMLRIFLKIKKLFYLVCQVHIRQYVLKSTYLAILICMTNLKREE